MWFVLPFPNFLGFREENVTSDDNSVWNECVFNAVFSVPLLLICVKP